MGRRGEKYQRTRFKAWFAVSKKTWVQFLAMPLALSFPISKTDLPWHSASGRNVLLPDLYSRGQRGLDISKVV